jgi:long-chain acyl-CoA synthetase
LRKDQDTQLMRTTVASYLGDFLSRGSETAFAHRRGLRVARWSYEQVALTAFQFARELEARGIENGDRVLLWAENSPEWVASFFGCLLRGAIVVPLDVQSDRGFVIRVQSQVEAKIALCDVLRSSLADLDLPTLRLEELSSLVAHRSPAPYTVKGIDDQQTLEIVFTSGTTAEPKGVRITHRNLLANIIPLEQEIKRYLKWERLVHPIRFLNLLPLSHLFGQFMGIFIPQLLRGEVFFQESLSPSQIIETIGREHISVVITVPRILDALREKIERDYEGRGQLNGLRKSIASSAGQHFGRRWWRFRSIHRMFGWKFWAFISGGATLNPATEEFWQRLGFALIQGYGMTETASVISVNHPFKTGRGSIGRVLPGQEMKLDENGEILVRGENISPGYWQDDGQAKVADLADEGWFRTGDIGELDQEGNLYFKGRKKEVIVTSAGVNIYPEDIELAIDRQPEIRASAVMEIEGAHGPEPLAVLLLRDDQADAEAVINRANESLAPQQQVRRWIVWSGEDFPRTPTQKVRKRVIAEVVSTGLAGAVPAAGSFVVSAAGHSNALAEIVSRIAKEAPARFDPSAKLGTDLKLDSLGRVELLSALEDRYQVEIDEAAFTGLTTLGEVEQIVREGKAASPRPGSPTTQRRRGRRGQPAWGAGQEATPQFPYPLWQQRWPLSWLRIALLYLIVLPATRIMGWPGISGTEHLRGIHGPMVFICNHVTMVDHALVLLAVPGRFRRRMSIAMDGELLREWLHPATETGLFTRLLYLLQYVSVVFFFNVFSMPQKSGFRRSFVFAGEMFDHGYNLLVFPEGQRTKHGGMNAFRPGTGLLVSQLDAPVVPMRIEGLWELKQANRHFACPGVVSVIIGEPVSYSSRNKPEEIARDLEERLKAL